jgi:hypothetical protein
MLAVQRRLPLIQPRMRSVRRPFHPSQDQGPYRLPHELRDRLSSALKTYRNRDSAYALAVFLARFWSVPGRVAEAFPIDRRELANRSDLGLTEAQVRGAIRVLEEVGFLDRALSPSGSKYQPTEEGLHRKPILFVFGPDYAPAFLKANSRAAAARGGYSAQRRAIVPSQASRFPTALPVAQPTSSPKSKSEADRSVIMGDLVKGSGLPPLAFEPDPMLEAALDRLLQGFRQSRGGSQDG